MRGMNQRKWNPHCLTDVLPVSKIFVRDVLEQWMRFVIMAEGDFRVEVLLFVVDSLVEVLLFVVDILVEVLLITVDQAFVVVALAALDSWWRLFWRRWTVS